MKELSFSEARKLVLGAIKSPLLIITVTDDTAVKIIDALKEFARFQFGEVRRYSERYCIRIGAVIDITAIPIKNWREINSVLPHEGDVIITSRQLTDIPRIVRTPVTMDEYFKIINGSE